jgi:ABC-type multidrug transport system ATPase subunit
MLEFNEDFDARITHMGQEINQATLSTGENKKLEFAVILAIIRIMKIKFPGLNILFLDEILSNLDAESVSAVLRILRKITDEYKLHVFIVNHAPIDNNLFDYIYRIEKYNEFSYIVKEQIN